MKKLLAVLLICFVFTTPITNASNSNSGSIRQYLPPADSDFFNIKFTQGIWLNKDVNKLIVYAYGANNKIVETAIIDVLPNQVVYLDFYCSNNYVVTFWKDLTKLNQYSVKKSTNVKVCPKNSIELSDYIPSLNRYAADTFKGTSKALLATELTNISISYGK